MHIGGPSSMIDIYTEEDLLEALTYARDTQKRIFVLGTGSNTLADDEGFDGIILHNCMKGVTICEEEDALILTVGAGEILDDICQLSVDLNVTGIEALSGIPGTMGAAPVQNVGAYGQEISDSLIKLTAYDMKQQKFVDLTKAECAFGYRHSIFRDCDWGRYFITSVTIRLRKEAPQPPFYQAVTHVLNERRITSYSPRIIRDIVMEIRENKLPDPDFIPNAGSFFKNAIITQAQLENIRRTHPDVPSYKVDEETYKVPTGWLIDRAGLKGEILYGMKVHDKNALILTNVSADSYENLARARGYIVALVEKTFGVTIVQEVLEIN